MKYSSLDSDTLDQLDAGEVYTSERGLKVILGVNDTVAFNTVAGNWNIAEEINWLGVDDFRPNKRRLEGLAEKWILAFGTDGAMDSEVADYLEIELEEAVLVLNLVAKAAVTITYTY